MENFNLHNKGLGFIGIIIFLFVVALIINNLYSYFKKYMPEVVETNEKSSEEIIKSKEEVISSPEEEKSAIKKCADGTLYGQCSNDKPKYCNNGVLIKKCSLCGCLSGQQCQVDENCKSIQLSSCNIDIYGRITGEKPCLCNNNLCSGTYCCNGRTCSTSSCGNTSEMNLAVILLKDLNFYLVGDHCTDGDCCGFFKPNYETPIVTFANNGNYKMLKPSDPAVANYSNKILIKIELNSNEIQDIKSNVANFVSKVKEDSNGSLILNVNYIELPYREITMNQWGCQFWIDPNNVKSLLDDQITKDIDFTLVLSDIYDGSQNGCIETLPICGGMRGADWDFFGVSYSYVPKTNSCTWYNCAETKAMYHEWLHELDFALEKITNVSDIYQDNFPQSLCGNANSDSYKWFPTPDIASADPDFSACKNYYNNWGGYCDSVKPFDCDYQWDKHLLSDHYNPAISLIGNHCRNGKQDFNETGVDCGGHCQSCL